MEFMTTVKILVMLWKNIIGIENTSFGGDNYANL